MTRQRILTAAAALFAERGYRATSMQEIAQRVGITKAALYYHFAAKEDLLHELTGPVLDELEQVLAEAEGAGDPSTVRWRAIEGYVDVSLRHRDTILMLVRDMTLLVQAPVADRFRAAIALANKLVCGPERGLAERVRAAQVVAGLGDPVVLFRDAPMAKLRRLILDGARALLSADQPASDSPTMRPPRRAGRPAALTASDTARLRQLHATGQYSAQQLADEFGVSRATLYRHLKNLSL